MSVDPNFLTIQKTRYSILVSQATGGSYSKQHFEYILRSIRFAHDPTRPQVEQYTAFVTVSVFDGLFRSEPAGTRVEVFVSNFAPTVLINGQTNSTTVMRDGVPTIPLFQSGTAITRVEVLEDSLVIQSVSIILTNPSHSDEQIRLSGSNIPETITVNMTNRDIIILTGPATPANFSQALSDSTIYYKYPPMSSILEGDRPDFSTR